MQPTMRESLKIFMERTMAKRELARRRQTLVHLVELYKSGLPRYKSEMFVSAIRRVEESVEHWTEVCDRYARD